MSDQTFFVKFSAERKIAILIVHVDDIILIGDYKKNLLGLKKLIAKEFEIKDLGCLKNFLDMKVARLKECIFASQCKCLRFTERDRYAWM